MGIVVADMGKVYLLGLDMQGCFQGFQKTEMGFMGTEPQSVNDEYVRSVYELERGIRYPAGIGQIHRDSGSSVPRFSDFPPQDIQDAVFHWYRSKGEVADWYGF
jgi:hypothetical protein